MGESFKKAMERGERLKNLAGENRRALPRGEDFPFKSPRNDFCSSAGVWERKGINMDEEERKNMFLIIATAFFFFFIVALATREPLAIIFTIALGLAVRFNFGYICEP